MKLSDDDSTSATKLREKKRKRAKRPDERCGFCLTRWVLSAVVRGNRSGVKVHGEAEGRRGRSRAQPVKHRPSPVSWSRLLDHAIVVSYMQMRVNWTVWYNL